MANISQIKVGNTTYNIDAVTLGGKSWGDIVDQVNTASFIVSNSAATTPNIVKYDNGSTQTQGTLTPANADANNIYLVPIYINKVFSYYDEYIVIKDKTEWVKLGTTNINLAGYAQDGTYDTTENGATTANNTEQTVTSVKANGYNADGTASVKYLKADSATGGGNGTQALTSGGTTSKVKTATFTGTKKTFNPVASIAGHSHTITPTNGTISEVTSASLDSKGSHTHDFDTHTHTKVSVVGSITTGTDSVNHVTGASSNSTGAHTHSVTGTSSTIASVANGVLTLSEKALTAVSNAAEAGGHSHTVTLTKSSKTFVTSVTPTSADVANLGAAATLATKSAGSHSHTVTLTSNSKSFMTGGTLNEVSPTVSIEAFDYTPAGTLSIVMDSHTHSYTGPASHTHPIGSTEATATGSIIAKILEHTHSVTIPAHSHTVNGHKHQVTIQ
jgi:hypothetical protein